MPGASIGVFSDRSLLPELLGKALGASAIDHAGSIGILSTTGLMNHVLLYQLKQLNIPSPSGNSEDIRVSMASGECKLAWGFKKTMMWA